MWSCKQWLFVSYLYELKWCFPGDPLRLVQTSKIPFCSSFRSCASFLGPGSCQALMATVHWGFPVTSLPLRAVVCVFDPVPVSSTFCM